MASKRATDFRSKSVDALGGQLLDLRTEQFHLRFPAAGGQLENTARVRQVRRNIARTKLILAEKTRAEA